MTIAETIDEVKEQICDNYCKYPAMFNSNNEEDVERFNQICEDCPLFKL